MRVGIIAALFLVFGIWIIYTVEMINFPVETIKSTVVQEDRLADFDLFWYNEYQQPIDQISIKINATGEIFAANLTMNPYLDPNCSGLFTAILPRQTYEEALLGFNVIGVRTR